ncbi:hexose kinase [Salinibacterium sp. SYSU T00001]|uniref:1-phosphofructokinase family hexose kinase n=1 Tax=Homoserinimonas sedimenticola TaxID=2986805 RepID=UPI002235BAFA|nr:hexose kinase [Salinibacterium sedimenticola]MCW4386396.1 hexose kinase [Salinibacterium sedimenticola]
MIVTLTANPSLDRTVELTEPLARGEVQRSALTHEQPGGKGVNVARALLASGVDTLAVLPGSPADPMLIALQAAGIPSAGLAISGTVRSNLTLTEPDGTTTKINEPGPTLSADDAEALIELVVDHARDAAWLVLAGSLPPGLPDDFYVRVVRAVRAAGGSPRVAVDSSGPAMLSLVTSGVCVDLIKPNAEELAELTGHPDPASLEEDTGAAASVALELVHGAVGSVLATLGSRGAVLVTAEGAWHASMPPVTVRSTVGAGDSSLAGYLIAEQRGETARRRLAQAVAHGAAAASLPGSGLPTLDQTDSAAATVTNLTLTHQELQ